MLLLLLLLLLCVCVWTAYVHAEHCTRDTLKVVCVAPVKEFRRAVLQGVKEKLPEAHAKYDKVFADTQKKNLLEAMGS